LALFSVLALALLLGGCVSWFGFGTQYDEHSFVVQTIDLFNQRDLSKATGTPASWRGDWIFRRLRLAAVDRQLHGNRPELLILQSAMEREGSPSESDSAILGAGVLNGYDWREVPAITYGDTNESQNLAVAVALPLKINRQLLGTSHDSWKMGEGGFLTLTVVDYESQPLSIFNVQMPPEERGEFPWYTFVQERVTEHLRDKHQCNKRVIIAGYMPGDLASRRIAEMLETLQMKETSRGFCFQPDRCFTSTINNEMFMLSAADTTSQQTNKIFVQEDTDVYSNNVVMNEAESAPYYIRRFGLTQLWPTQRYGWSATIRLARCDKGDYLN